MNFYWQSGYGGFSVSPADVEEGFLGLQFFNSASSRVAPIRRGGAFMSATPGSPKKPLRSPVRSPA